MAFAKKSFSTDERERLLAEIKSLREELERLKLGNPIQEDEPSNNLEDMLC